VTNYQDIIILFQTIEMADNKKDQGIIFVLLERFKNQRYPRALALKKKVDAGGILDEYDEQFLDEVFQDFDKVKALVERNPEYKELVTEILNLWNDIIEKNIENQKKT
jgi:hypothetical protein